MSKKKKSPGKAKSKQPEAKPQVVETTQEQRNTTVLALSRDLGALMDSFNKQSPLTAAAVQTAKEHKEKLDGIEQAIVRKAGEIRQAQIGQFQQSLKLSDPEPAKEVKTQKTKKGKTDETPKTEEQKKEKLDADVEKLKDEAKADAVKSYRDLDTDGYEKLFSHMRRRAKRYEATTPHSIALVVYGNKSADCVKRAEAFCVELVKDGYLTRADGDTLAYHIERDKFNEKTKEKVF